MGTFKLGELSVPQLPEDECYAAVMREAARKAVTVEDVTAVVSSIVTAAKLGDRRAQQMLLREIVGLGTDTKKRIEYHQHVHVRGGRRKKRKGNGTVVSHVPDEDEIARSVAEMRAKRGLPPAEYRRTV